MTMIESYTDSPQRALNTVIAQDACQYALRYIVKGSTATVNNTYSSQQRISLKQAMADLRHKARARSPFDLEFDDAIRMFYNVVGLCKKLSLGNCSELALLALEYVLVTFPDTRAEVYSLAGGDHTFLVIGRNVASLAESPETWGGDALICDPWAKHIFPAHQYACHLTNAYSTPYAHDGENDFCNHTEKFDKTRHTFERIETMTTAYLRLAEHVIHKQEIIRLFKKRAGDMLSAIKALMADLQAMHNQYGPSNCNRLVIETLITRLSAQTRALATTAQHPIDYHKNYQHVCIELQACLKQHASHYAKSITLTEENAHALLRSRYSAPKALWMRFFHENTTLSQPLVERLDCAHDELRTLIY